MESEQAAVHLRVTSWLFVAIATKDAEFALPLANVIASADFFDHSIPTVEQLQHGIRDLSAADLVTVGSDGFALTAKGRAAWQNIGDQKPASDFVGRARSALGGVACVSSAPGWSIDQRSWEDAVAAYSPNFALQLKRRRSGS
jgi:hypothetical protein